MEEALTLFCDSVGHKTEQKDMKVGRKIVGRKGKLFGWKEHKRGWRMRIIRLCYTHV